MNLFNLNNDADFDQIEFTKKQFANKFYSSLHDHQIPNNQNNQFKPEQPEQISAIISTIIKFKKNKPVQQATKVDDIDDILEMDQRSNGQVSKVIEKGKKRTKWNQKTEQIFFRAIAKFGTDFDLIERFFSEQTGHIFSKVQLKNKYNKEMNRNKEKIMEQLKMNRQQSNDTIDKNIDQFVNDRKD